MHNFCTLIKRWIILGVAMLLAGCTWTVSGIVTDLQGKGVAGVLVEVLVNDAVVKTGLTNASGDLPSLVFQANAAPSVRISKSGYATQTLAIDVHSVAKLVYIGKFVAQISPGVGGLVKYEGTPSETLPGEAAEQQALAMGLPSLDRSASVLGPDANANGIRDDIEAWIAARNDRTAEQKAAMMWYAKSLQAEMAAARTPEAALAAEIATTRAASCLVSRANSFDDFVKTSELIEDYMRNTVERVRESLATSRLLGGQSWALPNDDTCGDLK